MSSTSKARTMRGGHETIACPMLDDGTYRDLPVCCCVNRWFLRRRRDGPLWVLGVVTWNLQFTCPLVLENSPTFGLKSHAGTFAARALSVCRSCCSSVCLSFIMIIRSPTNACMLLKTKCVLEFKLLSDRTEQNPGDRTFLELPLPLFWADMAAQYRTQV